jgi:coenzyme F420-0:L-glutamate ligase / coenzyme F420-1:gamma-L-glutamate ligase
MMVSIVPVEGMPEVGKGDDVAALIADRLTHALLDRDIVVIAHKVVSKAEGRSRPATDHRRLTLAESRRVLRRSGEMLISETRHGFVCANAGVDASNVAGDRVVLLPLDPDLSARRLRARFQHLTGADVGVVITDTFGRTWRIGQTNVAIGVAGIESFLDYRGGVDTFGKELAATSICVADELAGAAEMVMGKTRRIPAVVIRGATVRFGRGSAADIVRPPGDDLFR